MNKRIYLIFGLFLLSSQSLCAASAFGGGRPSDAGDPTGLGGAFAPRASVAGDPSVDDRKSTFLDGFKPDATAESFQYKIAPFGSLFIGIETDDPATEPCVIGIGWATRGLTIGGAENAATWVFERENRICDLASSSKFEIVPGAGECYSSHTVSALDIKIAEDLYCLVYERDRDWQNYLQVERGVRKALAPILNPGNPSKLDAKAEAALGVWSFLEAMKIIAVQESLIDLYPINLPTREPSANKEFLAKFFNEKVAAYKRA